MSVKVFLSTVSDEFRPYRDQLRADLTRHNVEVKVQEDFVDLGGVGISYTQWEAWLALYHSKLLLTGKAEETTTRGPKYGPTVDANSDAIRPPIPI